MSVEAELKALRLGLKQTSDECGEYAELSSRVLEEHHKELESLRRRLELVERFFTDDGK